MISLKLFPVLCGTAFKNKGVQTLLDAVVDYLPSPLDIPATEGVDPDHRDKVVVRKPADDEPFSGLAFKIMADSFVGQLTFVRVYSGHLKTGDSVLNVTKSKSERIGRLLKMHANKREEIKRNLCRRHLRLRGPEEHHHGRYHLLGKGPDSSGID